MNDHTEMLPAPLQEDSFDVVMRGYSRGQVDDFVKRTKRQVEELETRLARAEREAEDARRDRERASSEAAVANRRLESHEPSYEDLGERLVQILKLAQEEAEEKRSTATAEAEETRAEAEAAGQRIHQEVEEKRSNAEAAAEQIRAQAHEEAERTRREADEAAEQVRTAANEEAERLVQDAQERSSELETSARERVEQLEQQHTELVAQLSSVRDSLQTLLPGQVVLSDQLDEAGQASMQPDVQAHSAGEEVTGAETATVEAVREDEPAVDDTMVGGAVDMEATQEGAQPEHHHR